MTRKKKVIIVVSILILGAVLLLGPSIDRAPVPMPVAPDKITTPGRFTLGKGRFLEVKEAKEGLEYWEGHEEGGSADSSLAQIVTYSAAEIPAVQLNEGWNIQFTPPDQIRIASGMGEVVQRTFGSASLPVEPEKTNGSVIRRKESNEE